MSADVIRGEVAKQEEQRAQLAANLKELDGKRAQLIAALTQLDGAIGFGKGLLTRLKLETKAQAGPEDTVKCEEVVPTG